MSSNITDSDDKPTDASTELNSAVEDLLDQLTAKFATVSSDIMEKMDDMARRLDNLETIIQQTTQRDTETPKPT